MNVGFTALLIASLGAFACSSDDSKESTPPEEHSAEVQAAATAVVMSQQSLVMADTLFKFDPDLDPAGTPDQNLEKVKTNIEADGGGCVKVTLILSGIKVDFGTSCTLQNGSVVSGAVLVKIEKKDTTQTLDITLGFETFAYDSYDLDGTLKLSTSNGSTFGVSVDMTHAGAHLVASLNVVGSPTSITIDGSALITASGSTSSTPLTITGLVLVPNACYPSGGSVGIENVGSLAFDANTPSTGQAEVTIGSVSKCYELPAYGTCTTTDCPKLG